MSAPESAAATPGQALSPDPAGFAYHVRATAFNVLTGKMPGDKWRVPRDERDAIARAVVDAVEPLIRADERDLAARQPQPAPGSASQVRRRAEQAAPGVCPRCGSQERTDRRQVRGFAGPTTACYSDWHDAGQPAPELAAYEVAIEQISRMCQRPKETAGTTQGVVVNGERLAGLILAVIKAAGLEGK